MTRRQQNLQEPSGSAISFLEKIRSKNINWSNSFFTSAEVALKRKASLCSTRFKATGVTINGQVQAIYSSSNSQYNVYTVVLGSSRSPERVQIELWSSWTAKAKEMSLKVGQIAAIQKANIIIIEQKKTAFQQKQHWIRVKMTGLKDAYKKIFTKNSFNFMSE